MSNFNPLTFARQNIKYHTDIDWPSEYGKVNYILRGDGLWEVRKNSIGIFRSHIANLDIPGFPPEETVEGFELALPKIPRSLLNITISFFRKLCEDHDFEAYVQIFWNTDTSEYNIEVPQQQVSKGRVVYEPPNVDFKKKILVCEIHSHNSMNAFFSGVDEADERKRGDRFFGVIGKLDTASPEIKMSFIVGGQKRIYIPVSSLFEEEQFPQEWLQRVSYIDHIKNQELSSSKDSKEEDRKKYFWRNQKEDEEDESEEENLVFIKDENDLWRWTRQGDAL